MKFHEGRSVHSFESYLCMKFHEGKSVHILESYLCMKFHEGKSVHTLDSYLCTKRIFHPDDPDRLLSPWKRRDER